jgi:hypothetical protein
MGLHAEKLPEPLHLKSLFLKMRPEKELAHSALEIIG